MTPSKKTVEFCGQMKELSENILFDDLVSGSGMSLAEFSQRVGYSETMVSQVRNGHRKVSRKLKLMTVSLLGLPGDYFESNLRHLQSAAQVLSHYPENAIILAARYVSIQRSLKKSN